MAKKKSLSKINWAFIPNIVLSILTLGFMAAPFFTYEGALSGKSSISGYDFLQSADLPVSIKDELTIYPLIITLIICASVFLVLSLARVPKYKLPRLFSLIIGVVLLVLAIVSMSTISAVIADLNGLTGNAGALASTSVGIGAILCLITTITMVLTSAFTLFQGFKKK